MPLNISEEAAAPAPPRTRKPRAASSSPRQSAAEKRASAGTALNRERREAVDGLFGIGAMGCVTFGQYADAAAISKHGPNIAGEVADLADKDPKVANVVDYITKVGPWAGLMAATLPLALQIAVNHNPQLPAESLAPFGIVSPEALSAQARADVMRQQTAMIREAQSAEAELAAMMQDAAPAPGPVSQETVDAMATHSAPGW